MLARVLGIAVLICSLSSMANACDWNKALTNITWVLDRDAGARNCFNESYRCQQIYDPNSRRYIRVGGCKSGFDSLLHCQRQNDDAQASIALCKAETEQYLSGRNLK